jgi:hypothetical protein
VAAVGAALAGLVAGIRRLGGNRTIAGAIIRPPTDHTTIDARGAVRSVQGAEIVLPEEVLEELWQPVNLERLARTYWAFLSKATLGFVKVAYTPTERSAVLLFKPLKLLTFTAPEYERGGGRGIVRWRIKNGLLVAQQGRDADGYLEIDVRRLPCDEPGKARIHVEVEVANFYPAIAHRLSRFLYTNTQSRIHVIVTYGFLRRLVRRELDESVTGRFAIPPVQTTEPLREHERQRANA